jgi:hypothetical protein
MVVNWSLEHLDSHKEMIKKDKDKIDICISNIETSFLQKSVEGLTKRQRG